MAAECDAVTGNPRAAVRSRHGQKPRHCESICLAQGQRRKMHRGTGHISLPRPLSGCAEWSGDMARNLARVTFLSVLGCVFCLGTTDTSRAQWVSVGGGGVHVRAPFVRVDVGPYGGVSVRAPFTSIDTRGRYYPYGPPPVIIERRIQEPPIPTADELAAMDDERLRRTLATTADRLHSRLRGSTPAPPGNDIYCALLTRRWPTFHPAPALRARPLRNHLTDFASWPPSRSTA